MSIHKPINLYVASGFQNRSMVQCVARFASINRHFIRDVMPVRIRALCDWAVRPDKHPQDDLAAWAETDYQQIRMADGLLALWPGGPGMASEMGYAIGIGKPVALVAPADEAIGNYLPAHHPCVQRVPLVSEGISLLAEIVCKAREAAKA